jgi:phage shock protein C
MATLTRPARGDGRIIAGVSGAIADGTGIPVNVVRILFVIFAWTGAAELLYLALWVILPNRTDSAPY